VKKMILSALTSKLRSLYVNLDPLIKHYPVIFP
jgi:hypothetical protein